MSGTDFPYSGYYVAKIIMSGAEVAYISGTDIYLDSKTAKDAQLSFEATAGGIDNNRFCRNHFFGNGYLAFYFFFAGFCSDGCGAGTYYVAVLPGELEDVYVAIYDEADALLGDRTANNAIPVARKQIRKLGTIGTGFAGRYYVKTTAAGNGDGSSWDNAADYAKLVTKLKETNSALTVYMASGTYKTGAVASMGTANTDANITIYGGYPAEATGMGISGRAR